MKSFTVGLNLRLMSLKGWGIWIQAQTYRKGRRCEAIKGEDGDLHTEERGLAQVLP